MSHIPLIIFDPSCLSWDHLGGGSDPHVENHLSVVSPKSYTAQCANMSRLISVMSSLMYQAKQV